MPTTRPTRAQALWRRIKPLTQFGWPPRETPPVPRSWRSPRWLWSRFKRLTLISWPRGYPLAQFPNVPLILAFIAGKVAAYTHGLGHSYAASITYLALVVWAYEELAHGVNGFRRLLGLAYVLLTIAHLGMALHR